MHVMWAEVESSLSLIQCDLDSEIEGSIGRALINEFRK